MDEDDDDDRFMPDDYFVSWLNEIEPSINNPDDDIWWALDTYEDDD